MEWRRRHNIEIKTHRCNILFRQNILDWICSLRYQVQICFNYLAKYIDKNILLYAIMKYFTTDIIKCNVKITCELKFCMMALGYERNMPNKKNGEQNVIYDLSRVDTFS